MTEIGWNVGVIVIMGICCDGLPLEKGLDAACLGNGCLYFDLDTDVRRIFG